ncbi:MAG: RecX family transcriptional regulator [Phycisphaerales bacterium]|nr:RecX family transcriptional regulator [Phycisphaerales bacterium]
MSGDHQPMLLPDAARPISVLKPDSRDHTLLHVLVGSRRVGDVPAERAESLGVRPGAAWTAELAAECTHAMELRRAVRRAGSLLRAAERTRAELKKALRDRGFVEAIAEEAVGKVAASGFLNDEAVTQRAVDRMTGLGRSDEAIRQKLAARGIGPEEAEEAIEAAEAAPDRAAGLAKQLAARLPKGLAEAGRWRRVLAGLARAGYSEEESLEAARTALGEPPEAEPVEPADE